MEVLFTPHFKRDAKRLPVSLRSTVEKQLTLFKKDPFTASLKTHKLEGALREYWAFSIDYRHRAIFTFEGKSTIVLHAIGDHSVYE